MSKEFKLFPWDYDEKPFWVNPENGLEWYLDETITKACTRDTLNDLPKLDAICFYVVEHKGNDFKPISRVLIDKKTNEVLADESSLEAIGAKIDWLRVVNQTSNKI